MTEEIVVPKTVEEFTNEVEARIQNHLQMYVCGNQSGGIPEGIDAVSAGKITGIDFFRPEDMVMGVKAGTPFSDIENVLSEKNMYLPIDPGEAKSTIGSIFSRNDSGASKLFMGGIRDSGIGIEYVNHTGRVVKAGGKVVKNVAGYDITKLLLGSCGGYGAITRLNFKVVPKLVRPVSYLMQTESASDWCTGFQKIAENRIEISSQEIFFENGCYTIDIGFYGEDGRQQKIRNEIESIFGTGRLFEPGDVQKTEFTPVKYHHSENMAPFLRKFRILKEHLHLKIHSQPSTLLTFNLWKNLERLDSDLKFVIYPFAGNVHLFCRKKNAEIQKNIIRQVFSFFDGQEFEAEIFKKSNSLNKKEFLKKNDRICLAMLLKKNLDPENLFYSPFFEPFFDDPK